jgi:hypothetical protein
LRLCWYSSSNLRSNMASRPEQQPNMNLESFMAKKRKERNKRECKVCQLPDGVRSQLGKPASEKGFSRPDQLQWLREACGQTQITMQMLAKHLNGRHEEE